MTVISCVQIGGQRGGGSKGILDTDDIMVWRITSDDPSENSQTIGQQVVGNQLPTQYAPHPNYPIMTVREIKFTPAESEKLWFGIVMYSSQPITKEKVERENYENPLDRLARISGDSEIFQRYVTEDINGNAVANTAGDPIEGGIPFDQARWIFHVQKNVDPTLPAWVLGYNNTTNEDDVELLGTTFPAGTLKVSGIKFGEIETQNDIEYIPISFDLHYDPDGWEHTELNVGRRQLVSGNKVEILDSNGRPYPNPQPLDSSGKFAPPPAAPYYLSFRVCPQAAFEGVLPLD